MQRSVGVILALLLSGVASAQGGVAGEARLLAATEGPGDDLELALARPDGSVIRFLTDNSFADDHPGWSPDGRRIVFVRTGSRRGGLYVLSLPRTVRRLTRSSVDAAPAYAPDGRRIAFVRGAPYAHGARIMVIDADGSGERVVATAEAAPRQLSWSPDGGRLLYSDLGTLRTVDVRTRSVSTLSVGGEGADFRPVYSYDGTQLAFLSYRNPRYYRDFEAWGVWVAAADGSNARKIAVGKYGPMSWSRDGKLVARFGYALALFDIASGARTDLELRGPWATFSR
jgi:TolB protein